MGLYHSVRAVAGASGDGPIDWAAVAEAAKESTEPGDLTVSDAERTGYATDVRDARDRVRAVGEIDFDLPETVEIQHRHHWIDANVETFKRVMAPIEQQADHIPGIARIVNTGSMAFASPSWPTTSSASTTRCCWPTATSTRCTSSGRTSAGSRTN